MEGALRIFTLNRVELMTDGADHPTQKPERLMRWCIGQAGDIKTVLDPFAGVASVGVAAKRLGVSSTLIECEESYCEIAANRLRQGSLSAMFQE